jgi:hypothetical protein
MVLRSLQDAETIPASLWHRFDDCNQHQENCESCVCSEQFRNQSIASESFRESRDCKRSRENAVMPYLSFAFFFTDFMTTNATIIKQTATPIYVANIRNVLSNTTIELSVFCSERFRGQLRSIVAGNGIEWRQRVVREVDLWFIEVQRSDRHNATHQRGRANDTPLQLSQLAASAATHCSGSS